MKRRINSTGRKSIPLEKVVIRLLNGGTPSTERSFSANLTRLPELGLDPAARVYVEAYVKSSSMRFAFGTVGAISGPADARLTEVDAGGAILFRVKVVSELTEVGKILASVNQVRPQDETEEEDKKAILPVRLRDLGEAVWTVDIEGGARPELVLNNRIPGLSDRLKIDPLVQGMIIPHAVARVLKAVLDDGGPDDSVEWAQDWRKFAAAVLGEELEDEMDEDVRDSRIGALVERFVNDMRFASRVVAAGVPAAGVVHD